jgi:hypothetical protein
MKMTKTLAAFTAVLALSGGLAQVSLAGDPLPTSPLPSWPKPSPPPPPPPTPTPTPTPTHFLPS